MDALGSLCSYPACRLHDFLPIPCRGCHQSYCKDHALPFEHACSALAATAGVSGSAAVPARKCDVSGCPQKAMLGNVHAEGEDAVVRCTACKGAFCITHRSPASHTCSSLSSPTVSQPSRAQQMLAKNFPSTSSTSPPKTTAARAPPTDPAKLKKYLAVQLMKMRLSATPADDRDSKVSVPAGDRLHVRVQVVGDDAKAAVLWFRKSMVAGRALDLLANRFKLSHDPGSGDPTRTLTIAVPGPADDGGQEQAIPIDLGKPLDGQVPDGGQILLVRGA